MNFPQKTKISKLSCVNPATREPTDVSVSVPVLNLVSRQVTSSTWGALQ